MRPSVVSCGESRCASLRYLLTCCGRLAQPGEADQQGQQAQAAETGFCASGIISGTLCGHATHDVPFAASSCAPAGSPPRRSARCAELWPTFGWNSRGEPIDLDAVFGRSAPRCLEIGFGAGEVIGALANANPEHRLFRCRGASLGGRPAAAAAPNRRSSRICASSATTRSRSWRGPLPDRSFDSILIFFPDPWHKKRHHKRRLIDAPFVEMLADKLRPRGVLRLATDWQAYAEQMLQVCNACARLRSRRVRTAPTCRGPGFRPPTRFERRGSRLGHGVWDLAYMKQGP